MNQRRTNEKPENAMANRAGHVTEWWRGIYFKVAFRSLNKNATCFHWKMSISTKAVGGMGVGLLEGWAILNPKHQRYPLDLWTLDQLPILRCDLQGWPYLPPLMGNESQKKYFTAHFSHLGRFLTNIKPVERRNHLRGFKEAGVKYHRAINSASLDACSLSWRYAPYQLSCNCRYSQPYLLQTCMNLAHNSINSLFMDM